MQFGGLGTGLDRLLGDRGVAGRPAVQNVKIAAHVADAGDAVDLDGGCLGRLAASAGKAFDLAATDASPRPGVRFTSAMSPSLVQREGRPRLVVGSAGSLRLRGAILQVIVNTIAHGLGVEEAIDRPRVHLEAGHVHVEGGNDPAELARLESWGYELGRWRRRNLFFGGVSGVEFLEDGSLAAAGDPRRGGHGVVVE